MNRSRLPHRGSIALCAALAMAMLSAHALAQNYSVTINPTLNGLDVRFGYQADEDILIVTMANNADKKVRCDFEYNAGTAASPPDIHVRSARRRCHQRVPGDPAVVRGRRGRDLRRRAGVKPGSDCVD